MAQVVFRVPPITNKLKHEKIFHCDETHSGDACPVVDTLLVKLYNSLHAALRLKVLNPFNDA